jgi:hypothetical protein
MLQLVEEALGPVSVAVEEGTERRPVAPVRERANVGPGAAGAHCLPECVAVVGAVGKQDLPGLDAGQHVGRAATVMALSFRELDRDRQAIGIDHGVDFGGQAAA